MFERRAAHKLLYATPCATSAPSSSALCPSRRGSQQFAVGVMVRKTSPPMTMNISNELDNAIVEQVHDAFGELVRTGRSRPLWELQALVRAGYSDETRALPADLGAKK